MCIKLDGTLRARASGVEGYKSAKRVSWRPWSFQNIAAGDSEPVTETRRKSKASEGVTQVYEDWIHARRCVWYSR